MIAWIVVAVAAWVLLAGAAALLLGRGLATCEMRERDAADPSAEPRDASRPRRGARVRAAGGRRVVVVARPAHGHR